MMLKVGPSILVADDPSIDVTNGVSPWPERHAAVRQVVIFLDGRIERAYGTRQPSRRETGEIIVEKIVSLAGKRTEAKHHSRVQHPSHRRKITRVGNQ